VSTIPSPFIGGTDSPRREADGDRELAPPFYPDVQAAAGSPEAASTSQQSETLPPPAAEPEAELQRTEEPVLTGAAADTAEEGVHTEEGGSEESAGEPSQSEPEEVIHVEVLEEEEEGPETTEAEEVAGVGVEATGREAIPIELVEPEGTEAEIPVAEAPIAGLEEIGRLADLQEPRAPQAAPELEQVPEARPAGADELEFPDYLLGPDSIGPEGEGAAEAGEESRRESPERLAEVAGELQRGSLGAWIRTLAAELGSYGAEIAVARAFAAGYLAAKQEEER
jgi:hypothetical protein